MEVTYYYDDVRNAAEFIYKNNPVCKSYKQAEEAIYRSIYQVTSSMRDGVKDFSYSTTLGFHVFGIYENPDWVVMQILVDPSLNKHYKGTHCVTEPPETIMDYLEPYAGKTRYEY